MKTLFNENDRAQIVTRLSALRPDSPRQWGTMTPSQALCHCANALETSTGDRPMKQALIGKILAPLVRKSVLGDEPFKKNSPTDPSFKVSGDRDFEQEHRRLLDLIHRFAAGGPASAARYVHSFFGKLTGDEWGRLMHKHLDHHLQQFGV